MAKKKKGAYRVGFDLGGTKMMAVVYDRSFEVLARNRTRTDAKKGTKALFADICKTVEKALAKASLSAAALEGIGMGFPGALDPKSGKIVFAPNLELEGFALRDKLARAFKVPAAVDNDVNMGVLAEFHFGAAMGRSNVLGVFPGTGIGGGLIVEGRLYRGASGGAGEIGHTVIDAEGPMCGCGRRGCLEAIAARPAIAAQAAVLALRGEAPHLAAEAGANLANIRSGALARSIEAGDTAVDALVRRSARRIGRGLSGVLNALSPGMVVLGGGLVEAMPRLFVKEVRKGIEETVVPLIAASIEVTAAKLGDDAVALGAAKLVDEALE